MLPAVYTHANFHINTDGNSDIDTGGNRHIDRYTDEHANGHGHFDKHANGNRDGLWIAVPATYGYCYYGHGHV